MSRVSFSWLAATAGCRAMNMYFPGASLSRIRRASSRMRLRTRFRVTAFPSFPDTEKPIFRSFPFRYTSTIVRLDLDLPFRYTVR